MIEERLIGFDVREAPTDEGARWDATRRSTYLLRTDVRRPLSVDTLVWPSFFDTGQGIGLPRETRTELGLAGIPVPDWIGPNAGIWEDLEAMSRYLATNEAQSRPHVVVAVSWLSDRHFSDAGSVGPYLEPTTPPSRDTGWKLLGFDVADGSLVSGLSNCGYTLDEVADLRRRWAPDLNSSHLFDDFAQAFLFRDLSDARVPEHAPFFVYGLYLVLG